MRSVYRSVAADSNEEAARIFQLLKEGAKVFMPMEETFGAFVRHDAPPEVDTRELIRKISGRPTEERHLAHVYASGR